MFLTNRKLEDKVAKVNLQLADVRRIAGAQAAVIASMHLMVEQMSVRFAADRVLFAEINERYGQFKAWLAAPK